MSTNYREKIENDYPSMSELTAQFSENELYVMVVNELINKTRRSDYNAQKTARVKKDREELERYRKMAKEQKEEQETA